MSEVRSTEVDDRVGMTDREPEGTHSPSICRCVRGGSKTLMKLPSSDVRRVSKLVDVTNQRASLGTVPSEARGDCNGLLISQGWATPDLI